MLKELVVLSGKGGTGKTSLTASFAALAENAIIADCDVDAANLHLVLAPEIRKTEPFIGGKLAHIFQEQCLGCGECVDLCRFNAILLQKNNSSFVYRIDPISCEGCGACIPFCPTGAISLKPAINGDLFESSTRYGPLVHARLGIAQENSGKLVALVRSRAREIAVAQNRNLIIVDGSPGIGCPVISSITGADAVLVVTEPTVAGLHDLNRVLDLTAHFRIPTYLCINKYDINMEISRQIERTCNARDVVVLGKIKFDPVITEAQVAGLPIVDFASNGVSDIIKQIWETLAFRINSVN